MIIKGRLDEISAGSWYQGINRTEFLIINGQRYRKLMYSDYIKSFLKLSEEVELSVQPKTLFNPYGYLCAIKVNGEIIKDDLDGMGILKFLLFLVLLVLFAIPAIAVGIATQSAWIGWATVFGSSWLVASIIIKRKLSAIASHRGALS